MAVTLRKASLADANAVARVLIESRLAFLPYAASPHTADETRTWVAQHLLIECSVVLAELAGEVVGVIATSQGEDCAWIEQLYVLPGHNSRGIGSRLMADAQAQLKRPIQLYTFQANAAARRFYERQGYRATVFSDGADNEEHCPDVLYVLLESVAAPSRVSQT
jgi:ribosomal protein S18 acetylase RimI-like enzyme